MAVRLLMGKRKKARNGYRLHEYNGDGNGYRDDYSEDEDEVFTEDVTSDGLAGLSKPLMHPRDRTKVKSRTPDCKCRVLCKPVLYFLLMVTLLGGLVSLLLYALTRHKDSAQSGTVTQSGSSVTSNLHRDIEELIGCDNVEVEDVWVKGFPKLLTESAFRLVDVNQDGVLDVILGFATGADGYMIPPVVCDIYFNGTVPCFGGLLALEGLTGRELWRHYSHHELFALNCNVDLDGDGVLDCLGGGRAAAFEAISCKEGKLLWSFQDGEVKKRFSNVYTPQYIDDTDGDHVPDIVVMHGGDPVAKPNSKTREAGRVVLMSGRTGKVLRWMIVPEARETYYSPQIYLQADGTSVVLFGTGGETHGGSLWVITLSHLKHGKVNMARAIYSDRLKGVMTPPVLVDLTGDGIVDIVINPFNSTVMAIDGRTYAILWNRTFPMSESYSTPAAGYFNDDDIPDFMVKAAFGPGYPVYYHAETTVLDGKTGQPLLEPSVRASVGAQSSALSISMEGRGHDVFLFWIADCLGHEGQGGEYRFVNGTNVHEQSRSDFCQLRFKTRLFSKLMAFSSAMKSPGATVYFSEERKAQEHKDWVNTTTEAINYLHTHPEVEADLLQQEMDHMRQEQRKTPLQRLAQNTEGYVQNDMPPEGNHSPGAKKGPPLQPQRGDYPPRYQPPQQRRPAQQYQPSGQQQQARPYDRYNLNPFDSNSYAMGDVDDSIYPRRGESNDETDGRGRYGYPYNLDQKPEYPGYYSGDRYGFANPDPDLNDGYQPYKDYFQKRNLDDFYPDRDFGETEGGDNRNTVQEQSELLKKALLSRTSKPRPYQDGADFQAQPGSKVASESERSNLPPLDLKERESDGATSGGSSAQDSNNSVLDKTKDDSDHKTRNSDTADSAIVRTGGRLKDPRRTSNTKISDANNKNRNSKKKNRDSNLNKNSDASNKNSDASNKNSDASNKNSDASNKNSDASNKNSDTSNKNSDASNKNSDASNKNSDASNKNSDASNKNSDASNKNSDASNKNSDASNKNSDVNTGNVKFNKGSWAEALHKASKGTSKDSGPPHPHFMKRKRRHIGPHDDSGLQRLLSTGTLAPSTLPKQHPDYAHTVDLVFATYWFFPSKTKAILPEDQNCIDQKMAVEVQRFNPENKYYGMDHDAYGHVITEECLKKTNHQLDDEGVYESQSTFDPYNIHMGQMTVYRLRIKCTCSQVTNTTTGKRCANILPYHQQRWPAYMGRNGDSYWLSDT